MRLPVFLGAGAVTTGMLLLGGLAATELNPVPVVNVDAMDLEARGRELWYRRDGKPTRIRRIYNRLIFDVLEA